MTAPVTVLTAIPSGTTAPALGAANRTWCGVVAKARANATATQTIRIGAVTYLAHALTLVKPNRLLNIIRTAATTDARVRKRGTPRSVVMAVHSSSA